MANICSLLLDRLHVGCLCVQCIVKEDKATGMRVVAGTHWDFDSYGGTIKKQLGMPTQVGFCISILFPPNPSPSPLLPPHSLPAVACGRFASL